MLRALRRTVGLGMVTALAFAETAPPGAMLSASPAPRIRQQLDHAAGRVDRFRLCELSDREWFVGRVAGGLALLVIIVVFATTISWVWRSFSRQEAALGDPPSFSQTRFACLMILPGLALILFVSYRPLILGIPLALFDFQLVLGDRFVGIDNFAQRTIMRGIAVPSEK